MISKSDIVEKAFELGFEDIGFTTAEPFEAQKEFLTDRENYYAPLIEKGLDLFAGTDPKNILPDAETIIVLMENYFTKSFPKSMERYFGRCYLDDDRMTGDGLVKRIKVFRGYLRDNGIDSKVPFHLSHRVSAARAGLGTYGKNCLFYSRKAARQGSWVLPIAIVVNKTFEADEPTGGLGCPDWCQNTCIVACPTGALTGPRMIDPAKCISYLTYYGEGITPVEYREPMGLWVYGCDRCQEVCPRNGPWLSMILPINERVVKKEGDFELRQLLAMDKGYFETKIWPHMFYMSYDDIWRWKMNVARVMGNSLDMEFVDDLVDALNENDDPRVKGMCVWALGRIGGSGVKSAKVMVEALFNDVKDIEGDGLVVGEIERAFEMCQ